MKNVLTVVFRKLPAFDLIQCRQHSNIK